MSIYEKIFKLRQEVGKVSKNAQNPFYKSKYFDINGLLEHIQPFLDEHKLLLTQPILDGVQYSIITDIESGEQLESGVELPSSQKPQDLGSAITYYRRYTLQSLLALQAEDDDGNLASKKTKPELKKGTTSYDKAAKAVEDGEYTVERIKKSYTLSEDVEKQLKELEG